MNNQRALQYLIARYNPSVGLLNEAPIDSNFLLTYWTMNDNGLAVRAFDRLGDSQHRDAVSRKLQSIHVFGHDALMNNGWADIFIHKPNIQPGYFLGTQCYRMVNGQPQGPYGCSGGMVGLMHEEANGGVMYDQENYFNLTAAKALSFHKMGNASERNRLICLLENKWDHIEGGFFSGGELKGTLELALYVMVGARTGTYRVNIYNGCISLMNQLQVPNGGFATRYLLKNGRIVWERTDTLSNTETTSAVVCALNRPWDY